MTYSATLSANAAASKRQKVLQRIANACRAHLRPTDAVTLLAVSKTKPADALHALYHEGQRDFGENYVQEALEKMPQLPDDICWHFIGPIQSNKTRLIAENFDWVHSVASQKIAQRLSNQRPEARPPLQACIQVNLEGESSKQGVSEAEAKELAVFMKALPRIELRGLMTIPPPMDDGQDQRLQFQKVAELARNLGLDEPVLSMGMSADLEAAVAAGSTMVRVGTALFGARKNPAN